MHTMAVVRTYFHVFLAKYLLGLFECNMCVIYSVVNAWGGVANDSGVLG